MIIPVKIEAHILMIQKRIIMIMKSDINARKIKRFYVKDE